MGARQQGQTMTVSAPKPAGAKPARAADVARLAAANINPATGLATDYLNHFNEAIMLLEMLAKSPTCIDDLMAWRPLSYREHFVASNQTHRELAIAAYEAADPTARRQLDELATAMNAMLLAAREALRLNLSGPVAGAFAQEAAARVKPLVARAGAIINGRDVSPASDTQDAIDALMKG